MVYLHGIGGRICRHLWTVSPVSHLLWFSHLWLVSPLPSREQGQRKRPHRWALRDNQGAVSPAPSCAPQSRSCTVTGTDPPGCFRVPPWHSQGHSDARNVPSCLRPDTSPCRCSTEGRSMPKALEGRWGFSNSPMFSETFSCS